MTIVHTQLTFDYRDEFGRVSIADGIAKLIESKVAVSPLVIDGAWGTGKTEFCHKLANHLSTGNSECRVVYIDAFKADTIDDPIMTILASILTSIPEQENREHLVRKALPVIRFTTKMVLKSGLSWLLRQDADKAAEELEQELKNASGQMIDGAVESLLKDHMNANSSVESLKSFLEKLAKPSPLVVIVDELDRCRPSYAVSMLENIKHIFSVTGVTFILSLNSAQLRASINHCYGSAVDAHRYLDKFVSFSITLPNRHLTGANEERLAPISHMINTIQGSVVLNDKSTDLECVRSLYEKLIDANGLSLREVETLFRQLEIYETLTSSRLLNGGIDHGMKLLRLFGIFVSCLKPDIATEILEGNIDVRTFADVLGKSALFDLRFDSVPGESDLLVAIASLESENPPPAFQIADDKLIAAWERTISSYFPTEQLPLNHRHKSFIISDAISTLRFLSQ